MGASTESQPRAHHTTVCQVANAQEGPSISGSEEL